MKSRRFEEIVVGVDLRLTAVGVQEADQLFLLTDRNRDYLAKYLPWVSNTNTAVDTMDFIKKIQQERTEETEYGFGIYLNSELVGHTSLMHLKDEKTPEIGYWISQDVSGRGLTTRVAQAVADFGFSELSLKEIIIKARVDNVPSNKVAEKIGFVRDDETYVDNGENINIWRKKA